MSFRKYCVGLVLLVFSGSFFALPALADTASVLKQQISEHTASISQLEAEISQYQVLLDKTTAQANTLKNTIRGLDTNNKKLSAQLEAANQEVVTVTLQIQELNAEIKQQEGTIASSRSALAEDVRNMNMLGGASLVSNLLSYNTLGEVWNAIEANQEFQSKVYGHILALKQLEGDLQANVSDTQVKKGQLVAFQSEVSIQKKAVIANENQQSELLKQTKNQESNYQNLIAEKKAKEAAFQAELTEIESQLNLVLNPASIPSAGSGVLAWPLPPPHEVTQLFGDTAFSRSHLEVYSGKGHNGLDIGASLGTKVMSAADGVVKGTGNTDLACPNASFGKWVMVEHTNGLSTLYAHLSVIEAAKGQSVKAGDVIGLSGMTGYATGPHLHFGVYASDGVEITSRASKSCNGAVYTMPIADLKAYLNPLLYLSADYKEVD